MKRLFLLLTLIPFCATAAPEGVVTRLVEVLKGEVDVLIESGEIKPIDSTDKNTIQTDNSSAFFNCPTLMPLVRHSKLLIRKQISKTVYNSGSVDYFCTITPCYIDSNNDIKEHLTKEYIVAKSSGVVSKDNAAKYNARKGIMTASHIDLHDRQLVGQKSLSPREAAYCFHKLEKEYDFYKTILKQQEKPQAKL